MSYCAAAKWQEAPRAGRVQGAVSGRRREAQRSPWTRPSTVRTCSSSAATLVRGTRIVKSRLTRFAREKYDHFALRAFLKSLGVSLRSATEPIDDTSTGKLMEGVLAAFAQFDNDVRSERTKPECVRLSSSASACNSCSFLTEWCSTERALFEPG